MSESGSNLNTTTNATDLPAATPNTSLDSTSAEGTSPESQLAYIIAIRYRRVFNEERVRGAPVEEAIQVAQQSIAGANIHSRPSDEQQREILREAQELLMTSPSARERGLPSEDTSSQNNPPTEFPTSAVRTRRRPMPERISAVIRRRRRQQQLQQQQHLISLAREQQELRQQLAQQRSRQLQQGRQQPSSRSRRRNGTHQHDTAQGVASSALARVEETRERLADLTSRLTSLGDLLDATTGHTPSAQGTNTNTYETRPSTSRSAGQQHRSKRRKLKHGADVQKQAKNSLRYGHYGSIVPGQLMLEIVSCDGGEYANDCLPSYGVQNVLRNDPSVYCTKSSRCNLMLRHRGEVAFTLERIVIEAPKRGFTAPVQQGLIFLSMTSENLIRDTKIYEKLNKTASSSPSLSCTSDSPLNEGLTLLESLHDPEVASRHERNAAAVAAFGSFSEWSFPFDANAAPDASYRRGHANSGPAPTVVNSSSRENADNDNDDEEEEEDPPYNWPLSDSEPRPPALAVTVSNDSGSEVDVDNDHSPIDIGGRLRRLGNSGRMPPGYLRSERGYDTSGASDDENADGGDRNNFTADLEDELDMAPDLFPQPPAGQPEDLNLQDSNHVENRITSPTNATRSGLLQDSNGNNADIENSNVDQASATGEGTEVAATAGVPSVPTVGPIDAEAPTSASNQRNNSLIQPHARFSMALDRGKVTVKFDPPVSCKFILLKLWSPMRNSNIDVQSVTAHGFAGPRYFPACKLR